MDYCTGSLLATNLEFVWQERGGKQPFHFVAIHLYHRSGCMGIFGTKGKRSFSWGTRRELSY